MPAALGRLAASQPDGWQEHYEPVDRLPGRSGLQTPRPNRDSTSQTSSLDGFGQNTYFALTVRIDLRKRQSAQR